VGGGGCVRGQSGEREKREGEEAGQSENEHSTA